MAEENGTSANAAAPAEPAIAEAPAVPASERLMGLIGMAVAITILAIGLDLVTGGWVSATLGSMFARPEADSDGG
jgi:hypothetical protein